MNEHINEQGLCYCGSLDCIGHLRTISDELNAKLATAQARIAELDSKLKGVREYIQLSINREDWSSDELAEPFWEELAGKLDLDLQLTTEVEVTFTVTYSGSLTVPKGADLRDLQIEDLPSWPDITSPTFEVINHCVIYDDTEVTYH